MFQRQLQPPPQPEPPKFEPSDIYNRLQTYSNSFFLFACTAGGILAVNVARISPTYFWLITVFTVAAIVTLAFFPNANNQQIRRIGIIAVAIGLLLGNWELIANFRFQPLYIAIGIGVVLLAVAVLAAIGGSRE